MLICVVKHDMSYEMLCTERDINLKNDKHFLGNHSALSLQNVRFVLCFYGHKVIINYSYTNIRTVEDACPYTQMKYDLNYIFFKDMRLLPQKHKCFRGPLKNIPMSSEVLDKER